MITLREIENIKPEDIKKIRKHDNDKGSALMTIWYMSQKINKMKEHLKNFSNDTANYCRFRNLLAKRKKFSKKNNT